MAVASYEYRYSTDEDLLEQAAWINAGLTPTVSLTGLLPGTLYGFQTRSKDAAGNYSAATATFFQTTTGVPAASDAVTFLGDAWTFLGDPITFTPPAGLFGP
jgi:hypothetical protein